MKLERQTVWIDAETTGVDPVKDRLIEFGAVVMEIDGSISKRWVQRFQPGIPIPAEATECHHITDEMVKDCPPFAMFAKAITLALRDKDIGGFNLRRLDLPILDEELRRCGLKLELAGVRLIDSFTIYQKKAPRDLAAAVREYCGREHDGAHGAAADASATADVFLGQMQRHPDLDAMTVDELSVFSRHGEYIYADLAGKLYLDADGDLRYAFGKAKDKKVRDDPGFGRWMLKKDFPGSTLDALEIELDRLFPQSESLFGHGHDEPPQPPPEWRG